jgi:RNA polymerase sigma factor (sigma-70 family)
LNRTGAFRSDSIAPDRWLMDSEKLRQLSSAMARLPYPQREVITLHLYGEMKFREIAALQDVSIKTAQSRYRCGLDRLRSLLNSKVQK